MPAHDGVNVIGKCSNRLARLVDRPGAKVAVVPCTAAVFSSGVPLDKLNSAVVPSASEARDSWCFPLVT